MIYIDNKELEAIYNMKKESAKKRLIPWSLSFEVFSELFKRRDEFTCFYTDKKFNLSNSSNNNYPSFERISESQGYQEGNICLCSREVNTIKADYIECGKSLKGSSDRVIRLSQRIKKVLHNPDMIAERMKPYNELYARVALRVKEESEKLKQKSEQQIHIDWKNRTEKEFIIAEHYVDTCRMFKQLGTHFEVTIKEFRDMLRRGTCPVTGVPFKSIKDKKFFVVDKTKPVIKSNIIVCTEDAQKGLDFILKGSNTRLKHFSKFTNKTFK